MLFLLAYDIFWIFVTKDTFGSDISKVDGSEVETPFKIALPRVFGSPYTNCARINLGDMVFPGMLIRYLRTVDLKRTDKRSKYWIVSFAGYALGQTLWTLSYIIWTTPLPPFLYITPLSVGATLVYSLVINDLKLLFKSKVVTALEAREGEPGNHEIVNDSIDHGNS